MPQSEISDKKTSEPESFKCQLHQLTISYSLVYPKYFVRN